MRHQPLDLRADELGLCLSIATLQVGDDALVAGFVPAPLALAVVVLHPKRGAVVPVEDGVAVLDGELAERLVHRDPVATGDRLHQVVIEVG